MKQLTQGHKYSLPSLLLVAASILALDQLTKRWVMTSLAEGEWWSPWPQAWRIFRITHTTNTGAAFGIFPKQSIFFVVVAIIVVVAIVVFYRNLSAGGWLIRVSLGLQLGGAIGNLLDRLNYGHVVDFIDVGFWPVFNVADSSIVIGVAIIAYYLWREDLKERAQDTAGSMAVVDEEASS